MFSAYANCFRYFSQSSPSSGLSDSVCLSADDTFSDWNTKKDVSFGEKLANDGVLDRASDIWMLKLADLWGYLDGDISAEDLWRIADRNQKYYDSFANYMSDNEIVPGDSAHAASSKSNLHGLGVCSGIVTGTARVIEDFSEIDRLKEGDILVTKFTDTGWTPKFAILSGIVTEYGGILCHGRRTDRAGRSQHGSAGPPGVA